MAARTFPQDFRWGAATAAYLTVYHGAADAAADTVECMAHGHLSGIVAVLRRPG